MSDVLGRMNIRETQKAFRTIERNLTKLSIERLTGFEDSDDIDKMKKALRKIRRDLNI